MYKLSFLAIGGLVLGLALAAPAADKRAPGGTVTGYIVAIEKNANGTGTITIQTAGRAKKGEPAAAGPERKFTYNKSTKVERVKGSSKQPPRPAEVSDLVKDLLVDWRLGEGYFADRLIDFDLASNSGGWQWAASVGCDAQPWFRIFNPVTQSEKFDPQGKFIRRYLPELANVPDKFIHAPWCMPINVQEKCGVRIGSNYPEPLIEHKVQREKALSLFKA